MLNMDTKVSMLSNAKTFFLQFLTTLGTGLPQKLQNQIPGLFRSFLDHFPGLCRVFLQGLKFNFHYNSFMHPLFVLLLKKILIPRIWISSTNY